MVDVSFSYWVGVLGRHVFFEGVILSEAKDPFAVRISRADSSSSASDRFSFCSRRGTPSVEPQ
jgi:hypothetical protein